MRTGNCLRKQVWPLIRQKEIALVLNNLYYFFLRMILFSFAFLYRQSDYRLKLILKKSYLYYSYTF